jgi:hypothetical protein
MSGSGQDGAVTVVVVFGAVVGLFGVLVWFGLLIWAARGDGRTQRKHDQDAKRDRRPGR